MTQMLALADKDFKAAVYDNYAQGCIENFVHNKGQDISTKEKKSLKKRTKVKILKLKNI